MKKLLLILLLISSLFAKNHYNNPYKLLGKHPYDIYFYKYYNKYFNDINHIYTWKLLKAQGIQESTLNPWITSYVGAAGVMQFMPATWRQMQREIGVVNIRSPKESIRAGAYYDKKLYKRWSAKRTLKDRLSLTFASYNAGLGNLYKAQKICKRKTGKTCNRYSEISSHLHYITGLHHKETLKYVKKIWYYYGRMEKYKAHLPKPPKPTYHKKTKTKKSKPKPKPVTNKQETLLIKKPSGFCLAILKFCGIIK